MDNIFFVLITFMVADILILLLQWLLMIFRKRFGNYQKFSLLHLICFLLLFDAKRCFSIMKLRNKLQRLCYSLNSKRLWIWKTGASESPLFCCFPLIIYHMYQIRVRNYSFAVKRISAFINVLFIILFITNVMAIKYNLSGRFLLAVLEVYYSLLELNSLIIKYFNNNSSGLSTIIVLTCYLFSFSLWIYVYAILIPFLYVAPLINGVISQDWNLTYLFISYYVIEIMLQVSEIDYTSIKSRLVGGKQFSGIEKHDVSTGTAANDESEKVSRTYKQKATVIQMTKCVIAIQKKLKRIRQRKELLERMKTE